MIFADTGALLAVLVKSDAFHAQAMGWLEPNKRTARLLTTDYVLDEVLTLLRTRGELKRARLSASARFAGKVARVHFVAPEDLQSAAAVLSYLSQKSRLAGPTNARTS